jgi:uncharacterized protein
MKQHDFIFQNRNDDPVRGTVHLPDLVAGAPVIILCHGFKGFKDWGFFPYAAEAFARAGWIAIRYNGSCNGIGEDLLNFTEPDKFRRNTISTELSDMDEVVTAVAEHRIVPASADADRIVLLGHSRGGGTVLLKASTDSRIAGVITWAAIATLDRWGEAVKRQWRHDGVLYVTNARTGQQLPLGVELLEDGEAHRTEYDILCAAVGLRIPLLIVHGEQDVSVSIEEGRQLHEHSRKEMTTFVSIPNTDHTFGCVHPFAGSTKAFDSALEASMKFLAAIPSTPPTSTSSVHRLSRSGRGESR